MKYLCKDDKVHGIVEGSKACRRGYYFLESSVVLKNPIIQDGELIEDPVKLQEEIDTQYKRDREKDYPVKGDQLDLIYKTFKYLKASGIDIGPDGDAYVLLIGDVKIKHPKPQE